jgi:hypothetical protein
MVESCALCVSGFCIAANVTLQVPNVAIVQNYVFWEVILYTQTLIVQRFGEPTTSAVQSKRMTLKLVVVEDSFITLVTSYQLKLK